MRLKRCSGFAVLLALAFLFSAFSMPKIKVPFTRDSKKSGHAAKTQDAPQVSTYAQLIDAIRKTRAASEKRVQAAADQEKVREAWEIGKLIDQHVLLQKDRAQYGQHVVKRLGLDLGMSDTELGYMLRFARTYPIAPPPGKLTWAHYRELLSLDEVLERDVIAKKAVAEKMSSKEVRAEVKKIKIEKKGIPVPEKPKPVLKPITPGRLHTFKVVRSLAGKDKGELVLDLGFANTFLPAKVLPYMDEEVVEFIPATENEPSHLAPVPDAGPLDLNNYEASIVQVIDGDTVWAKVEQGFGISTHQRLRLNHIDAPEILTSDGQQAKAFLEKLLRDASSDERIASEKKGASLTTQSDRPSVVIHVGKPDNYGRYLVDLFLEKQTSQNAGDEPQWIYVNQKLLDEGLAVIIPD